MQRPTATDRPTPAVKPIASWVKHPKDLDEFLLYRMNKLAKLVEQVSTITLRREVGISLRDCLLLALIDKYPEMNLTHLAKEAGIDKVIASRCVTRLVDKGLLVKPRLRANKRLSALSLTGTGRTLVNRALLSRQKYNEVVAACLTDDEADTLHALLEKLERRVIETRLSIGSTTARP